MQKYSIIFIILIFGINVFAQEDSVDVTFYHIPGSNPSVVYLPGEFNNWGNNNGGVISDPQFAMIQDPGTGIWYKTERLRVGGPNPLPNPQNGIPGAYQYKFNEGGSSGGWLPDPLNPRQNQNDYNNSYLYIKNPTIHYLLPNSTQSVGIIRSRFPEITAYIFPSISGTVDTSSISIQIDSLIYSGLGTNYDTANNKLTFTTPVPLGDGTHKLVLFVNSNTGAQNSDSTNFTIQANIAQVLTHPAGTWKDAWRIQGAFFNPSGGFDTTVTQAQLIRSDSIYNVTVDDGIVDTTISLLEGDNIIRIQADISGQLQVSDSIIINRKLNHTPTAIIEISQSGSSIDLIGSNSVEPDSQELTFLWKEDISNPEVLGIQGIIIADFTILKPVTAGEYYMELIVKDPELNADSTRCYFVIESDSVAIEIPGYADNPNWVKNARIYTMFIKAFTPEGTILQAMENLDYVKSMGFNVIWVLPVMEIPGDVDNQINIGYYIMDFYNVESSYGTNQDFKDFVQAAHDIGLKVILDVTPNHTGNVHPFAIEASTFGDWSPYWNYYQTEFIPHNTNGLGQSTNPAGIYYYSAFSDVLLNYDWSDLDARKYMIDVYEYWIQEMGVDGYRFDVYWGPHRRYGETFMGIPVREALKHFKPDILLLGEDNGTGVGTEVLYADQGGGLDASYDFKLYFSQIRNFGFNSSAVSNLHNDIYNGGYFPGENSNYLRFLESQDEDRISYFYDSFIKTMPMATAIYLAPGMPMMYNGQEVGFGRGMGNPGEPDLNDRRRGIIDWNFGGKDMLQPHYQKLAQIRAQFPAFSQHKKDTNGDGQINNSDASDFIRITTGNGIVYAFMRPYTDANGIVVANFSNSSQNASMNLVSTGLSFSGGFNTGSNYWVNDLYNDTSYQVLGSDLLNFSVMLGSYGSAVYTISTEEQNVILPPIPNIITSIDNNSIIPSGFNLFQNYPNPFNPDTNIQYSLPVYGKVLLEIYDVVGKKVVTLADKNQQTGNYTIQWDGRNSGGKLVSSGVYFYKLKVSSTSENTADFIQCKKMILLR
jgi:glycosidase